MLRSLMCDLFVVRHYLKQAMLSSLVVAAGLLVGIGDWAPVPCVVFMMSLYGMVASLFAYDEQNGWGAYRAALPCSRRQIVQGRYALVLVLATAVALAVMLACIVVCALGHVIGLPAPLNTWFVLTPEAMGSALFSLAVCAFLGMVVISVCLPVYFKLGSTKAAQWLPFVLMLLCLAPTLVLFLTDGSLAAHVVDWLNSVLIPPALYLVPIALPLVGLAVVWASSLVATRLYEGRDL